MKNTGFRAPLHTPGRTQGLRWFLAGVLALGLLTGSTGAVRAQVKVEVVMDQDQFVPGESVPVAVRVINHSGQTLHFGEENWLSYSVESRDGFIVDKTGESPVAHGFEVQSADMATQHADLGPFFNLTRAGRYKVTATVRIKDWGTELTSEPKNFTIIRGFKLWEQEFGMPQSSAANSGPPETRKYILQQATYLKSMRLYLRLTDLAETKVFRVQRIGPMVSFSRLQTQLDKGNNLHVLYEEGARTFIYTVASPDGEITLRQTYYYTDSGPRLQMDDAGKISVAGGLRRVASNDLPPTKTVTLSNDPAPPKP
jgi:hypothetical protein